MEMNRHSLPRVLLNATDGPLSVRAVRRYVTALAKGLAARPEDLELHLLFFTHRRGEVRQFIRSIGAGRAKIHTFPWPRSWSMRRYAKPTFEMRRLAKKVDLYHETTVDHPVLGIDRPYLMTVHGLSLISRPDLCDPGFLEEKLEWFHTARKRSTHFVPVSETSRDEFLAHYPEVAPDHVRAVPLGVDDTYTPGSTEEAWGIVRDRFGVEDEYLLYVGGVQRNKNIERILETAQILRDRGEFSGPVVLAGDLHYDDESWNALLDRTDSRGHVITTGYLSPEDPLLVSLYRGARLFLFPTFYEGWTSPPLEAMACGTPVIASSASSVPETVGWAAELVDPDDAEGWAESAARVLHDRDRADELRRRGFARTAIYRWDRTVEHTLRYYREVLGLPVESPEPTPDLAIHS